MLTIKYQKSFKRDYKRIKKCGYDLHLLKQVITLLAEGKELPLEYNDHSLVGNLLGCRECHITPDWLLIYQVMDQDLLLYLTRTGTHSDLF